MTSFILSSVSSMSSLHDGGRPGSDYMRIFVTGGTGLVGTRLVEQLLDRGDQLVVLTRRYGQARQSLGPHGRSWSRATRCRPGDVDGQASPTATASSTWPARTSSPAAGTPPSRSCSSIAGSRARGTSPQALAAQAAATPTASRRCWSTPRPSAIYGPHGDEEIDRGQRRPATISWPSCASMGEGRPRPSSRPACARAMVRVGVVLDKEGGAWRRC